jgi:hypothetical protein
MSRLNLLRRSEEEVEVFVGVLFLDIFKLIFTWDGLVYLNE